ncbi:hydroxymethylpyrimidine/phosphomethylpyrimidine kinase [Allostella sp. ATCC 35155]|nr:hydroxymethylpyrimidine/phosphomethylpyrimidine kinase [Stella sp. ATCC 35155]
MRGRVLIVAGSDSGGGAGIQADIKTVTALGGFAMTAITALTAQNTLGVHGVLPIAPDFIARQMEVVLDDLGADAVKTGMLHDSAVIRTVADMLAAKAPDVPLVCDPVMIAKGGHALLVESAVDALRTLLLPRAAVLTPNLPEAETLLGRPIGDLSAMEEAAVALRRLGPAAVLLKGGHGAGEEVVDVLADAHGVHRFRSQRIATRHTHGTGCTLASAIATGIAQGMELAAAVGRARDYVQEAIRRAPGYGAGHGPLDHGYTMRAPGS